MWTRFVHPSTLLSPFSQMAWLIAKKACPHEVSCDDVPTQISKTYALRKPILSLDLDLNSQHFKQGK